MKMYGGVDIQIHIFLTSALAGCERSASRLGERSPCVHWIGGWVSRRAGLDDVERRTFLILLRPELRPPVFQPISGSYTDYTIPAIEGTH
jgi:hypothetical protein